MTANLWRENPDIGLTLRTLLGSGADVIGCNEAAEWIDQVRTAAEVHGYRVLYEGTRRPNRQNPVLMPDHIRVDSVATYTVSDAVGRSPERTCTEVVSEVGTIFNVHGNSHVQEGRGPHELPRVGEYVDMWQLLMPRLRAADRPILLGDLNWAWTAKPQTWKWAPQPVFDRLGMVCQYDHGMLPRPKGDPRAIEYVAWDPDDFAFEDQAFLTPERSDHPFPLVGLRPL